ncbi:uncharacterized protein LOC116128926 [Pistacia vera]|uniref:uncharacterized protein LOC116128926 n=1 Tax=Pistacia vera TaxID=55513 RepID=UPI001263CBBF|nr:uncharacterized protein LOC116128926 [Pistacia vera]
MRENESTYYIHCFAHQLQITLVAIAKNDVQVGNIFNMSVDLVNVVRAFRKWQDILRECQVAHVSEALANGKLTSGHGLNQEAMLKRVGDTHWGLHYGTLASLIVMFPSVVDVLDYVVEDGSDPKQRAQASTLLKFIQSFDFIFSLHLMKTMLGITNELSNALQRKDQDIANAMKLVKLSKQRLQMLRDDGWDGWARVRLNLCHESSSGEIRTDRVVQDGVLQAP